MIRVSKDTAIALKGKAIVKSESYEEILMRLLGVEKQTELPVASVVV